MDQLKIALRLLPSLLLLVIIASCNGQNTTASPQPGDEGAREESPAPSPESTFERIHPTNPEHFDRHFQVEGQLCQHLREIIEDDHGNLWFGTNIYGIIKFDGDTLIYHHDEEGFEGGRVTGSLLDDDGHPWFAAHGGLYKFNGASFNCYNEQQGLSDNQLFGLIEAVDGSYWTGSLVGASRFDGKQFTNLTLPNISVEDTTSILGYDRVSCLIQDRQGIFWFGRDGFGICKYDPEAAANGRDPFTHITTADGLPGNNISSLYEAKDGRIWIGTMYGGMCIYDGKSFELLSGEHGIEGVEAGNIYEDKNGHLWFPVEHHGVYRYDGENFTNFNEDHGLRSGGIICMYEDSHDRFWLGGWLGLFRYDPEGEPSKDRKPFSDVTIDGPWD